MDVLVKAICRLGVIICRLSSIFSAYIREIDGRMDFAGWSLSGKVAPSLK
jgi:hypothetical protein